MIKIIQIPALVDNYIYLIIDQKTKKTACLDPAESELVLTYLKKNGLKLDYIFNTHHHLDHVGGNLKLKKNTGCKVVGSINDKSRIPGIDITLGNMEKFYLGSSYARIYETPGHTIGHICFHFEKDFALFCGDTLFSLGCGRMFEGSPKQMWNSLKLLRNLDDNTKVYCGHEYTEDNAKFAIKIDPDNVVLQKKIQEIKLRRGRKLSTIPSNLGEEKITNPFLRVDQISLGEKTCSSDEEDWKVFEKIRKLKDIF